MSIFIKPAISHLRESKLTFDDAELVLHFGSESRLVPISGSFFIGQLPVAAALRLREIFSSWRMVRDSLCMIITGGENVYSVEVEQVIYDFNGVDQCCVIGIPHEKWGETVHAVVVSKQGHDLDREAILAHCAVRLANYKRPLKVTISKSPLPISGAGKILRRVVRDEIARIGGPLVNQHRFSCNQ
jgi:hypothetical protein